VPSPAGVSRHQQAGRRGVANVAGHYTYRVASGRTIPVGRPVAPVLRGGVSAEVGDDNALLRRLQAAALPFEDFAAMMTSALKDLCHAL